ncbi:MAG: beta strand repeat-containing protein [Planctomycetota bacterium]
MKPLTFIARLTCLALLVLPGTGCKSEIIVAPTVTDDAYNAVGNCTLTVSTSVLDNDTGGTLTVSTFDATSTNGGTVSMAADGTFTYTPVTGDRTATDTFTYTAHNTAGNTVGTVTITIGGMVWFVDNSVGSNGDGSQASPFDSISSYNTANPSAAGDTIVLASTGTDYTTAGITLLASQRLLSTESDVVVNSITVATGNATRVLMAPGADAITLNAGNTVAGIDVGDTGTGYALIDGGVDTGATTVSSMTVSGTGGALFIDNGATGTAITFASITSTGSAVSGVVLQGGTGSLTVSGATSITNCTGDAIDIETCSGTVTFGAVSITGHVGSAFVLDTNSGTITIGDCTLGVPGDLAGIDTINISVADCSDLTFGDITMDDADSFGVRILSHSSGSLTFGDITITNTPGAAGFRSDQTGGTITVGAFSGSAAPGSDVVRPGGTAQDITFTSITTSTSGNRSVFVSGTGSVNLGAVTAHAPVHVDGSAAGVIDVTASSLAITSSVAGLLLASGNDGNDTFTLTGTGTITASDTALLINNFRVDDGGNNGIDFDTIACDGAASPASGIDVTGLQDNLTINTSTTITNTTAAALQFVSTQAGVTVTFAGTTTLGQANPDEVAQGIDITSGNSATSTFSFSSLSVVSTGSGIEIADVIVAFGGTPPTVDSAGGDYGLSLQSCTSPNAGADTWTFGAITQDSNSLNEGAAVALNTTTAVVEFSGNVTATNFSDSDQTALFLFAHTGDVTVSGNISAIDFAGQGYGVLMAQCDGNATFSGSITVSNLPGTSSRGIAVWSHVAGDVAFDGVVSISGFTGTNSYALQIQNGTVNVAINAAFTATNLTGNGCRGIVASNTGAGTGGTLSSSGAGAISCTNINGAAVFLDGWETAAGSAVDLTGGLTITGCGVPAINLDNVANEVMSFGDVSIDSSSTGGGVFANGCTGATLNFANLDVLCPGTDGFIAINLRGNSDGSNAGMNFSLNATDGTSGIRYPANAGNGTAIFADQLALLAISGTAGNLYVIDEVGTGPTDGAEANIPAGPHAIYARDCALVNINFVNISHVGDLATSSQGERAVFLQNLTMPLALFTLSQCTIGENVDGHGVHVLNQAAGPGVINITGNLFDTVTNQTDSVSQLLFEIDGSMGGDVSADITITGNTIQNCGNSNTNGVFLTAFSDAGATTPVRLRLGDGTVNGANTFSNVSGDTIRIFSSSGAMVRAALNRNTLTRTVASTPGAALFARLTANTRSSLDLLATSMAVDGYDFEVPVQVFSNGFSTNSEFRFAYDIGNTFANCGAARAAIYIEADNAFYTGLAETGVFDITIGGTNFASTLGIEQSISGSNPSLMRMYIKDNTNLELIALARDSGSPEVDRLVITDEDGTSADPANDAQIAGVLQDIDSSGNNNTASAGFPTVVASAGDAAAVIDQLGGGGVAAPTAP